MGCECPSSTFSSDNFEVDSEIVIDSGSKNLKKIKNLQEDTLRPKWKKLNLDFTQDISRVETNTNLENYNLESSALHKSMNNPDLNSNKIIIRLSMEKFNELFDDRTIECYNTRKYSGNLKIHSLNINYKKIFNKKYNRTKENTI